jgi:hypothetical protein
MKSALRRALNVADDIESFKWAGAPGDDPDGIFYSIQYLRELAIRLRSAAQRLDYPPLRDDLERLPVNIDGNDFAAGVALYAELRGIADWLRDAVEEWGDDPSRWQSRSAGPANPAPRSPEEIPFHTKERESLLKLVIGMAVGGYGYDRSAKSKIPGQIASDLDELGLRLDVDTVRKFLKQGLELVPRTSLEEDR